MSVTVEGKVYSVKEKSGRDGPYQGVSMTGDDGAKYWFGNYKAPLTPGARVRVTAGSTGSGNNITFLNQIKSVERERAAVAQPPAPKPAAPPEDTTCPQGTGWEDPADVNIPATAPAAASPEPEVEADHKVAENDSPLGTLDDLADGADPSSYGGVIIFRKGTTKSEVEFLLRAMKGVLAASDVREFDGKKNSPVFYIP